MRIFIPIVYFAAFFGCARNTELTSSSVNQEGDAGKIAPVSNYSNDQTQLIKTADFRFQVDNVKNSSNAIEASIARYPAFVSSSELRTEDGRSESRMSLRVRSDFFDELLKEIDKEAVVIHHRNISTQDVSKEFVDLESRINTKREVEARYIEILRSKAGTIKEVLEAEKQIGSLQEEIEATVGKLNYLRDQVSYNTINLEFYQPYAVDPKIGEEKNYPMAFSHAFNGGLNMLIETTLVIVGIWPIALIALFVSFVLIRKRKKITIPSLNS
jgi:hypothetical protein